MFYQKQKTLIFPTVWKAKSEHNFVILTRDAELEDDRS